MESPDYEKLISAISLVLAVLTYFLSVSYTETGKVLAEPLPDQARAGKREQLRRQLRTQLVTAHLPLLLGFAALFYLCLPTAGSLIVSRGLAWWGFDLLPSLFVCLEIGVGACLLFQVVSTVRAVRRLNALV